MSFRICWGNDDEHVGFGANHLEEISDGHIAGVVEPSLAFCALTGPITGKFNQPIVSSRGRDRGLS